ncbi:MAG: 4Fe-4S binding protein [Acidobacteria bacterium]|nr:4Fe-4S binding protein [Acidobacteriota bacterium]
MIQPEADPWGFEEEPVETLADILQPQIPDLAMLVIFLLLAYVSFRRKSVPLKYAVLVLAVAYMGFWKSTLISITDVFRVVDRDFPIFQSTLLWYGFAGFTLLSTVLWGRFYCGRVCAFGALTQLMDAVLPAKWRVDVPRPIEAKAAWIKFGLLAAVLVYYIATHDLLVYQYVEPFWMFTRVGTTPMWIAVGTLLVASMFVRNLYCRFLCPVGATLGILSNLTVFRIKRWSECSTCKICQKTCQFGAIEGPKILVSECVRCDDCERMYADEQKCPHWRILDFKAKKAARVMPLTPVS